MFRDIGPIHQKVERLHQTSMIAMNQINDYYVKYQSETKNKLDEFSEQSKDLQERFKNEGPGSEGSSLDKGLELVKVINYDLPIRFKQLLI